MAEMTRMSDVPGEVLKAAEASERKALDAVHTFVSTVNRALPEVQLADGDRPGRQELLDAAFTMSQKLLDAQNAFLREVFRTATGTIDMAERAAASAAEAIGASGARTISPD